MGQLRCTAEVQLARGEGGRGEGRLGCTAAVQMAHSEGGRILEGDPGFGIFSSGSGVYIWAFMFMWRGALFPLFALGRCSSTGWSLPPPLCSSLSISDAAALPPSFRLGKATATVSMASPPSPSPVQDAPALPPSFRLGKATATVSMAGSHLSPTVDVSVAAPASGTTGEGRQMGGGGMCVCA